MAVLILLPEDARHYCCFYSFNVFLFVIVAAATVVVIIAAVVG